MLNLSLGRVYNTIYFVYWSWLQVLFRSISWYLQIMNKYKCWTFLRFFLLMRKSACVLEWSLGWNACTACAVLHVRETPSPDSRRSVSLAPSHTADLKSKKKIGLFFQSIPRNWNTSSRSCVECEHGTGSHLRSCHRFTDGAQSHYSRWIFQKTWDLLMGNWSRICIFLKPWKHWKPWKRFKDCLEMIQKRTVEMIENTVVSQ